MKVSNNTRRLIRDFYELETGDSANRSGCSTLTAKYTKWLEDRYAEYNDMAPKAIESRDVQQIRMNSRA